MHIGMDNTGTKKSKNNAKATRRFWNKREEEFLIGAMKDVFLSDPKWKRDNNQFRPGFYNLCEKKILLAFAGTDLRASPHIESKIKLWRKQYSTLYDMVNASGLAGMIVRRWSLLIVMMFGQTMLRECRTQKE